MKFLIFLLCLGVCAHAKCPDLGYLTEFDETQYVGHWYEAARYPLIFELGETCSQANYTLQDDGSIRVKNRGRKAGGGLDTIEGTAKLVDPARPAEFALKFDEGFSGTYNVIKTDYNSSALVYSCGTTIGITIEYAWILTREPQLDQAVIDEYVQMLADAGSHSDKMSATPQDCGSHAILHSLPAGKNLGPGECQRTLEFTSTRQRWQHTCLHIYLKVNVS